MVDTLKYLAMGGRIGKAQALLGGVLQFNPIVGIRDGEAHPADRPRIRRRAQRRIIELVRELAPIHQLHVSYSTGRLREASRTTSCSQWERRLDRYYKEPGCSNRPKAREGGLETRRESLGPNRPALFMSAAF